MSNDENNIFILATPIMLSTKISAELWSHQTFAPEWFKDALHEAQNANDYNSMRREIIFAVAFAESYLFEWLRDDIFKGNYNKLLTYCNFYLFRKIHSPKEKWKEIPKKLYKDGLIPNIPKIENIKQEWDEFDKVIKYRNGLSHGASSIPQNLSQPTEESTVPPLGELHKISPGWAIKLGR